MKQEEWIQLVDQLKNYVRLSNPPVGMKWLRSREELEAIPKVRTHAKHQPPCVIVSHAVQFHWTSACLFENFHANYCRGIHGLFERDEKWHSGEMFRGIWIRDAEGARAHHAALNCVPAEYYAVVASPLASGRLPEPDVCVLYVTPAQAFMILTGYQYEHYEALDFTFVGESTCSDSWTRTFLTGKPSLALPCYADKKFAGVSEHELRLTFTPQDLQRVARGLAALSGNGLRYPIASYSLSCDILDGLPASYLEY